VWLSATAVYFLMRWTVVRGVRNLVAGFAVALVVLAAPWHSLPNDNDQERLWNPFEHLLGASWTLTAVLLLAWFAAALVGSRDVAEVGGRQPSADPGPLAASLGARGESESRNAGIRRQG
jgi:hypothetical protein